MTTLQHAMFWSGWGTAGLALLVLCGFWFALAVRRAPELGDDSAPPEYPPADPRDNSPWRRLIDTQLSRQLAIAREGRH